MQLALILRIFVVGLYDHTSSFAEPSILDPVMHLETVLTGASRCSKPVTDRCIEVLGTRGDDQDFGW
jgi:hypothetical protein